MSEQQIDHAANIINLMQEKDQQLSTLSANYRQVLGEREDLDLELNRSVMVERELPRVRTRAPWVRRPPIGAWWWNTFGPGS